MFVRRRGDCRGSLRNVSVCLFTFCAVGKTSHERSRPCLRHVRLPPRGAGLSYYRLGAIHGHVTWNSMWSSALRAFPCWGWYRVVDKPMCATCIPSAEANHCGIGDLNLDCRPISTCRSCILLTLAPSGQRHPPQFASNRRTGRSTGTNRAQT